MPSKLKRKLSIEDGISSRKQIKFIATQQKNVQKEQRHIGGHVPRTEKADSDRSKQATSSQSKAFAPQHSSAEKRNHRLKDSIAATAKPVAQAANPATKRRREEEQMTPQNKRFKDALPPSPAETPTRGASNLFDRLDLAAKTSQRVYGTPPLTPEPSLDLSAPPTVDLPDSVQELPRLFTAFMNATSLYVAHHGAGSPIYLSTLLPRIAHTWKKRRVSESDLQRLLGILGEEQTMFTLIDNGNGNISLEQAGTSYAPISLTQKGLSARFERRLKNLWTQWRTTALGDDALTTDAFLDSIPLATVFAGEFAAAPGKVSKGQARLDGIQQPRVQKSIDEPTDRTSTVSAQAKTPAAVSNRGSSLLDRIMAKQQVSSSGPSGPTPEEMDRRAAMGRVEEIARVMDLLVGGRPRVSFSMQQMIQHLQNSLRNPISKDEARRCLDLMAEEISPSFVSLIRSSGVCGVVVKKMGRPSVAELHRKLQAAGM